jgi:hypothetical protein
VSFIAWPGDNSVTPGGKKIFTMFASLAAALRCEELAANVPVTKYHHPRPPASMPPGAAETVWQPRREILRAKSQPRK